jgi:cysteinyl-tRNA synthetase
VSDSGPHLYSTLTRRLEPLEPGPDGTIGIYVCGPTVYAPIHIGNARPFVVFMVLKRYLERRGERVRLVSNLTDVNDKIYAAARAAGVPSREWAQRMSAEYVADTDRLGLGRPDAEPTVTDSMERIVDLIGRLIDAGRAYEAGGDVYFRVREFPRYGALSGQRLDEMAPSEDAGAKEDALDFALWKGRKEGEDAWWDSPWGPGRPGWHIECSAMAEQELGCGFQVHGGGIDLAFPHHENEIAQTESAGCERMARIWAHNEMLELSGDKMSKSAGNIALLREVLDRWPAEVVIAYFLTSHYRSRLPFSEERMADAQAVCDRLRNAIRGIDRADPGGEYDRELAGAAVTARARVHAALDDDFNTPEAFAAVFDLVRAVNARLPGPVHPDQLVEVRGRLVELLDLLGLGGLAADGDALPPDIAGALAEREAARAERDFARADDLRARVEAAGYEVVDTPDGPHAYPRRDG